MAKSLITIAFRFLGVALLLAGLTAGAIFAYGVTRLPAVPLVPEPDTTAPAWPEPAPLEGVDWTVFQKSAGTAAPQTGALGRLYRLAGTFFAFGQSPEELPGQRTAVIDDLQQKQQFLVREGDAVKEYTVIRIFPDRVVLRNQGVDQELWLSFSGESNKKSTGPDEARLKNVAPAEPQVLETTRFGKRVGQTRWVFGRQPLMDYYNELLDNPERLASLFLSLKPDYQQGQIAGYRLDVEGEGDFFRDIGLAPGDVIRKVNSMNMVSQSRAEFLIGEFVKGRLSAVVMDVERQSQPSKLIYLIR